MSAELHVEWARLQRECEAQEKALFFKSMMDPDAFMAEMAKLKELPKFQRRDELFKILFGHLTIAYADGTVEDLVLREEES